MRKFVLLVLAAAVVSAGIVALSTVDSSSPAAKELTEDIAAIEASIAEARAVGSRYVDGSLLRTQIDLRIAVLSTTKDMLEQKKRSWIHGINLSYVVSGQKVSPSSQEVISAIEQEIAKASRDAATARSRAEQYSGGLVQSLALVEEQTHLVTVAINQQRLSLAKLGVGLPTIGQSSEPPAPLGRKLDDRGAL